MPLDFGLHFESQSSASNRPHILSFDTARTVANDTLFEVWNGATNAALRFAVDLNGKLHLYSTSLAAGDLLYGGSAAISGLRRLDHLVIGSANQGLRVNSGATAPEWAYSPRLVTSSTTSVSTSGTGEDNLISYSLPASTLITNGQLIRITVWGTVTGAAGTHTIRLKFGGTTLATSPLTVLADNTWRCEAIVVRTGAATQEASATAILSADNNPVYETHYRTTPGETLSGAITIKCTGECGDGADTITQTGLVVEFLG